MNLLNQKRQNYKDYIRNFENVNSLNKDIKDIIHKDVLRTVPNSNLFKLSAI